MSPNPLEILKKGFTEFSGTIKKRKDKLTEKLSQGEGISPSEIEVYSSHMTQPTIPVSTLIHSSDTQTDPLAHAEQQVELALDELVLRGTLQKENRMDIDSLFNPAGASYVLTEATDADIYQAVMDVIEARENIETNGGDDVDDDGPVEPCPAPSDLLSATSMIVQYISSWNDPLARQLEPLLGSFDRHLHLDKAKSMKPHC
jgi:hypothetical protein